MAETNGCRYLMHIGSEKRWVTMAEAGPIYDNGQVRVSIGGEVMELNGKVRPITEVERQEISDRADAYSDSK